MQNTLGGMNPWFYQSVMTVETVGLFKTAERNPEKRPICQGLSLRNHQTTVCGNKTGPLSENNSGTEPRVHI